MRSSRRGRGSDCGPGSGPEFGPDCGPGFGSECGRGFGPDMFVRHHHGPGHMHGPGVMCGPGHMHGPGHTPGPGARFFERGGIKFAILGMLKDKPRHGYDIIREMEECSGGFYSPSPGVIYPTLQALEDQDLVTSTTEEGKKVYAITEAGTAFLEEHKERAKSHRERWEAHWGPDMQGEGWEAVSGIRETLRDVKGAVRKSAGDSARLKEIGAVLEEAAGKIRDIAKR